MKPHNEYKTPYLINGHKVELDVKVYVIDTEFINFEDLDDETIRLIETGELAFKDILVETSFAGLVGRDSIGSVSVMGPKDISDALIDHGLELNSIEDLVSNIKTTFDAIKPLLTVGQLFKNEGK